MLKGKTLKSTSINLRCVTFVFTCIYVNREVTFIKLFSTDYLLGSPVEASCCKLNAMSVMFLTIL